MGKASILALLGTMALFASAVSAQSVIEVREGGPGGPLIAYNAPAGGSSRDFQTRDINAGPTAFIVIYISNLSTNNTDLVMGTPVVQGPNPNDFVKDTTAFTQTVPAGASTTFTVAFDPVAVGIKNGIISFTVNDQNIPNAFFRFDVTGNAVDNGFVTIDPLHKPPAAKADNEYNAFSFGVTGGLAPYNWFLNSGTLPPGLVLTSSGGLGGVVVANPGIYNFSIAVQDTVGRFDTEEFSILVYDPNVGDPPQANVFTNDASNNTCAASALATSGSIILLLMLGIGLAVYRRRSA